MSEYPHARRVGAYGFFLFCALCCGLGVAVILAVSGVDRAWAKEVIMPVAVAVFLALRDMTKRPPV